MCEKMGLTMIKSVVLNTDYKDYLKDIEYDTLIYT